MNELEDALRRAEAELAETKAAIAVARGETVEALAAKLAALQLETTEFDARARGLEEELGPLRDAEKAKLDKLA